MDLNYCSGPWVGWWAETDGIERHENMSLTFEEGNVDGSGHDENGSFALHGRIYKDGTVSIAKVYIRPNKAVPESMAYLGVWDSGIIEGVWIDDNCPGNHGPIRLAMVPRCLRAMLNATKVVLDSESRVVVTPPMGPNAPTFQLFGPAARSHQDLDPLPVPPPNR